MTAIIRALRGNTHMQVQKSHTNQGRSSAIKPSTNQTVMHIVSGVICVFFNLCMRLNHGAQQNLQRNNLASWQTGRDILVQFLYEVFLKLEENEWYD
jgi:hypothetical protein